MDHVIHKLQKPALHDTQKNCGQVPMQPFDILLESLHIKNLSNGIRVEV